MRFPHDQAPNQQDGHFRHDAGPEPDCFSAANGLEHDPEKWPRFSLATNAERVCAEIMLK